MADAINKKGYISLSKHTYWSEISEEAKLYEPPKSGIYPGMIFLGQDGRYYCHVDRPWFDDAEVRGIDVHDYIKDIVEEKGGKI